MRLLDLFCGAGGAAMGYHRAGFDDITGIDIKPMPRYPFKFIQGDALEYLAEHGQEYDVIHASPPCQAYTMMQNIRHNSGAHADLVAKTRELLDLIGKPYVIENVYKAPLKAHIMLCGTMFGLNIIRHRYFESKHIPLVLMPPCDHRNVYDPYHGENRTADKFRQAMGIDWMPVGGGDASGKSAAGTLAQAIPPAYTEWIGKRILEQIRG
jgi:DNA (cytosine-5)-methyltransferase 1